MITEQKDNNLKNEEISLKKEKRDEDQKLVLFNNRCLAVDQPGVNSLGCSTEDENDHRYPGGNRNTG